MQIQKDIIKSKLQDYFAHQDSIDAVILYGSFAKGNFNEYSDIDLVVHSKESLDFDSLATMQVELSLLCGREIDISDLSKAEGVFLHQVMTTGERIKFDHAVFHKYLMKALYFYEDFLPIIRACRAKKIKRFVNGSY